MRPPFIFLPFLHDIVHSGTKKTLFFNQLRKNYEFQKSVRAALAPYQTNTAMYTGACNLEIKNPVYLFT